MVGPPGVAKDFSWEEHFIGIWNSLEEEHKRIIESGEVEIKVLSQMNYIDTVIFAQSFIYAKAMAHIKRERSSMQRVAIDPNDYIDWLISAHIIIDSDTVFVTGDKGLVKTIQVVRDNANRILESKGHKILNVKTMDCEEFIKSIP